MEYSGKRDITGEVQKEWMDEVKEWKDVEEKTVEAVKREENISETEMHMSKRSSFFLNGKTIRCSEKFQSWFINRELKSVCILSHTIFLYYIYIYIFMYNL